MLTPVRSGAFKRDVKRAQKRGKEMAKLRSLLQLLLDETTLPERYRDHPLKGGWTGWRDAHIEPDWLLIYRVTGTELLLARTGSHSDLFEA
jgi:mRNA interferase YafQ